MLGEREIEKATLLKETEAIFDPDDVLDLTNVICQKNYFLDHNF